MSDLAKCTKRIFSGERCDMGGHPCPYKGVLEYQGKPYCKLHYPPNVEAKTKANYLRWDAKWDAQEKAQDAIQRARAELVLKAAAYDRLVACLDDGGGAMAIVSKIRGILDGERKIS